MGPNGVEGNKGKVPFQSFSPASDEDLIRVIHRFIYREQLLTDDAVKNVRATPDKLVDAYRGVTRIAFDDAVGIACLESTALFMRYPALFFVGVEFFPAYRLLRAMEFAFGVPRAGYSLMVGSGVTTPEFLAQYIQPPHIQDLTRLVLGWRQDSFVRKVNNVCDSFAKGDRDFEPVALMDGHAIGVEPDKEAHEAMRERNQLLFHVPPEPIKLHAATIGEVIEKGYIPRGLQRVLWHRAEPAIVGYSDSIGIDIYYLNDLLRSFNDFLTRGGHFILTIGGGNNDEQASQRLDLVAYSRELLRINGFMPIIGIPQLFNGFYSDYLGDSQVGMIAAVVGKKII